MKQRRISEAEWRPIGVASLEPNAYDVVRSICHTAVIAGPGAGKTELLAQRACYLFQTGASPYPRRILAISFKRDSANNLRNRVTIRCSVEDRERFDSLTFDSFAKSILDRFYRALPTQWRPTPGYEIFNTTGRTYDAFLNDLDAAPDTLGGNAAVTEITRLSFERDAVLGARLHSGEAAPETVEQWAALAWWRECLHGANHSRLTFPMIGRLAELLIRTNPQIRDAMALCYSHVFMDEFQDTTHVQYDLVHTAFHGTSTVVTAVGDDKQQIMRWAMALDDSFNVFEVHFAAKRIPLAYNYRSSPDLVRIQHILAQSIDAGVPQAFSQSPSLISDECCSIHSFPSAAAEATFVASIIAEALGNGLRPRDFVILVRQRSGDYETQLRPAFEAASITLRNESQLVGNVMLQDLLCEGVVEILLKLLRISTMGRAGTIWNECVHYVRRLGEVIGEGKAWAGRSDDLILHFGEVFRSRWPTPADVERADDILTFLFETLGHTRVAQAFPHYRQGDWLEKVSKAAAIHLQASCLAANTWSDALDAFEGLHSVPLMTIHKSKGLEYHTVIFMGLDDNAWWSFAAQPEDGRSAFFVAFSRAMQRVIFTYRRQLGRMKVASLYELLSLAGVKEYTED